MYKMRSESILVDLKLFFIIFVDKVSRMLYTTSRLFDRI